MRIDAARRMWVPALVVITGILTAMVDAEQQRETASVGKTRIVMLGTGNPAADPDRSGPATAIVVNDTAYLIDFGPGVIRRAKAAVIERGVTALEPTNLRVAFVTHLHSDHTVGYADLIFSPWTLGRRVPIDVYGPAGIKAMTSHLLEAYRVDIETRTNADGNQHAREGLRLTSYYAASPLCGIRQTSSATARPGDASRAMRRRSSWTRRCPGSRRAAGKRPSSSTSPSRSRTERSPAPMSSPTSTPR
jgi:hypothetical protein